MKKYRVIVNGEAYEVELEAMDAATVSSAPAVPATPKSESSAPAPTNAGAGTNITAPMPGNILSVNVNAGQTVKAGDVLFILEAMKMENEILAPSNGTVTGVSVNKGQAVETGALLCTIA